MGYKYHPEGQKYGTTEKPLTGPIWLEKDEVEKLEYLINDEKKKLVVKNVGKELLKQYRCKKIGLCDKIGNVLSTAANTAATVAKIYIPRFAFKSRKKSNKVSRKKSKKVSREEI